MKKFDYYITKNGHVACVPADQQSWSMHYEDEEADGYTSHPFDHETPEEKGWEKVGFHQLPAWAKVELAQGYIDESRIPDNEWERRMKKK